MALAYMRGAVVGREELQNATSAMQCVLSHPRTGCFSLRNAARMRTPQSSARWRLYQSLSLLLLLCSLAPCFAAAFIDRAKGKRLTELFTFVGTRIGGRGSWIESHRKSEPKVDDRILRRTCALHERSEKQTKDIFWALFWTRASNQRGG